jgi:ubiquinone/menaquinone biosynthesis C-methylase UbiE
MINSENKYTQMQLNQYNGLASLWSEYDREPVVGSFDAHNNWSDYEILFERIENQNEKIGLDFACGPGRNSVRYKNRFKRLDGIDISSVNIQNAIMYNKNNGVDSNFYVSNGINLDVIESDTYDFVMSTIALQHICVYDIRYNIFSDIFRILKPNGIFTAQMGFGPHTPAKNSVGYYDNFYDANESNGSCDTRVEDPNQLKDDLEKIGFSEFNFQITTTGPGDRHPNWIFFSAVR